MIGALRTWLLSIIAAGLVLAILYALVPKGRLRPIVRTTGGVALMLVILRPVLGLTYGPCRVLWRLRTGDTGTDGDLPGGGRGGAGRYHRAADGCIYIG